MKITLDEDAGKAFGRVEARLLGEMFRDGYRSDVVRILIRHFEEHPPEVTWIQRRWRQQAAGEANPGEPSPSRDALAAAPLVSGGQV